MSSILSYEQIVQINLSLQKENDLLKQENTQLKNSLDEIKKYYQSLDKFATTVYDPNKLTYKELENKLALAENSKQAEIDELYETKIVPLQNQLKDREIKMESMYNQQVSYTEEISHLKKVIENLGMLINYAVGYISACEQFRDKHPNYVKDWLFEGLK